METILQIVTRHGYSLLFGAIFVHQIGLPLPGPLFLLAAGALAGGGKIAFMPAVALTVIACVLADWPWYEAGRSRGDKVLHFIHRLTHDPDYHDRKAKQAFARFGPSILLLAKFVPGLDAIAPPLAGTSRTSRIQFFAFDAAGAALYAFAYASLGYFLRHDLTRAALYARRAGATLGVLALAMLAAFSIAKLVLAHIRASRLAHSAPALSAQRGALANMQASASQRYSAAVERRAARRERESVSL